ncbi:MAG: hypothetical protein ACOX2F_02035 [bacterium]
MKKITLLFSAFLLFISCNPNSGKDKEDSFDEASVLDTERLDLTDDFESTDNEEEIKYECTKFKIKSTDIVIKSGTLSFEGPISNINGEAPDILKFSFINPDGSSNYQIKEKTYDLGSLDNSNADSCTECLWVISDILEDKPSKLYFQQSGTFEVLSAGKGIEAKGKISARLIEVKINKGNVIPVKNGSCIEVENGEIDSFCYPKCNGLVCGDDGCGGECGGGCLENEYCSKDRSECIKYDCAQFTIETLENLEIDRKFLYHGKISNIDGEEEDYMNFRFYNEDRTYNYQIEKKIYDLGSGDNLNPSTCTECLWVSSDFDSDSSPKKKYFQQSGTYEVLEAGKVIEARGILNARLIEMEQDKNGKNSPLYGGSCIEIKNGYINTLCEKQCEGKVCGDDGCKGICGNGCGKDEYCSADQTSCIEYDCKKLSVIKALVDPGWWVDEYKMGIFMDLDKPIASSELEDAFNIELTKKIPAGIYDLNEERSIHLYAFSFYDTSRRPVRYYFAYESGKLEILNIDYDSGLFQAKLHKVRLIEVEFIIGYGYAPVTGGICFEVTDDINGSPPVVLKKEVE